MNNKGVADVRIIIIVSILYCIALLFRDEIIECIYWFVDL